MHNLLEYEYVQLDSDFIIFGFTILYYKCDLTGGSIKRSILYIQNEYVKYIFLN